LPGPVVQRAGASCRCALLAGSCPLKFGDPLFHLGQQLTVEFFDCRDERAGRYGRPADMGGGELDLAGLMLPGHGHAVVAAAVLGD
jgi:hypothetical protein